MNPSVFLGLVTHRNTRYPASAGPEGLVSRVSHALTELGVATTIAVHDDDRFDTAIVALTRREVLASIDAELDVEARWRRYVDPAVSSMILKALMTARRGYRRLRLAPPWSSGTNASPAGARMLRRLVNIELAHLHLMRAAIDEAADWALIVEDDADLVDPQGFARDLAAFIEGHTQLSQPDFVNVSRSFESGRLGIERHLTAAGEWGSGIRMLSADQPLTNTVCAVLYRGRFLQVLLPTLERIPISPVLPIDWKLNAALLALYEAHDIGSSNCWFLDPGPITQGSMHAAAGTS